MSASEIKIPLHQRIRKVVRPKAAARWQEEQTHKAEWEAEKARMKAMAALPDEKRERAFEEYHEERRAEHLENFIELMEVHPELSVDVVTFPDLERKQVMEGKGRIIDAFPELRPQVEAFFDQIVGMGMVSCRSKLQTFGGMEYVDYGTVYEAGINSQIVEPKERNQLRHLINGSVSEVFGNFSNLKGQGGFVLYDSRSSAIASYENHIHLLIENVESANREYYSEHDVDQAVDILKEVASHDDRGGVMFFSHTYGSGTYFRGHPCAVHMTYVMPGYLGEDLEQEIVNNPWFMEALSELVVERADEELSAQTPDVFRFSRLYQDDMSKTIMHKPSISKKVRGLFSFYNKPN